MKQRDIECRRKKRRVDFGRFPAGMQRHVRVEGLRNDLPDGCQHPVLRLQSRTSGAAVRRSEDALEIAALDLPLRNPCALGDSVDDLRLMLRLQLRMIPDEDGPAGRLQRHQQFAGRAAGRLVDDDKVERGRGQSQRGAPQTHAGSGDDLARSSEEALEAALRA
nr:hypothetical protein [Sinorhizobium medicae]